MNSDFDIDFHVKLTS